MSDVQKHESIFPFGCNVSSKSRMRFCQGSASAPKWIVSAHDAMVVSETGVEYIDLTAGLGAITLGHRHNPGTPRCFPLPSRSELLLAEKIQSMVPWAWSIRLAKNGGDATTAALRLARVYTSRDKVLDFGSYHGCQDPWITSDHAGVPDAVRSLTERHAPTLENLAKIDGTHAAVILETAPLNPLPEGFLAGVRQQCHRTGTVMIGDETISGFRSHPQGAAGLTGVIPDLTCAGKAMANGWPISCVWGDKDIMSAWTLTHLSATHWAEPTCMDKAVENLSTMESSGFWARQAKWTWGGQASNGHWSVLKMDMLDQTYAQLLLLRAGILTNFSQFYYLDLQPHEDRIKQAFDDALGALEDAKNAGTDIASLLDCEVNRTTFKRN